MTFTTTTPSRVTTIFRLPSSFASAWSPGFDLHVSGETTDELVNNLRNLAMKLLERADDITTEKGKT